MVANWLVDAGDGMAPHVRPLLDLRDHLLDVMCWCVPTYDEGVWVHHSMDRREEYENGRLAS